MAHPKEIEGSTKERLAVSDNDDDDHDGDEDDGDDNDDGNSFILSRFF